MTTLACLLHFSAEIMSLDQNSRMGAISSFEIITKIGCSASNGVLVGLVFVSR